VSLDTIFEIARLRNRCNHLFHDLIFKPFDSAGYATAKRNLAQLEFFISRGSIATPAPTESIFVTAHFAVQSDTIFAGQRI